MFDRVLIGIDEHQGGRDAVALGKRLLAPFGALTLANVYAGDPHVYRSASASYDAAERVRSLELLENARGSGGLDADLKYIGSPSVGRGLHELAEREEADLLVVGSSRHGLLGRVLVSDDTRAALNGAPCAVAVAPAGYAEESEVLREIGVGYDGSPESLHALELARTLASRLGARLSAFTAVSVSRTTGGIGQRPLSEVIGNLVDQALRDIRALGGVEPHAAYGRAGEELALYSASLDLLVVGSRGYGPIGRLVHGSTSLGLAHTARCPLLVLPRGARPAEPRPDHRETYAGSVAS
jgi:nucleotide-binding universal stress UspA family protein